MKPHRTFESKIFENIVTKLVKVMHQNFYDTENVIINLFLIKWLIWGTCSVYWRGASNKQQCVLFMVIFSFWSLFMSKRSISRITKAPSRYSTCVNCTWEWIFFFSLGLLPTCQGCVCHIK